MRKHDRITDKNIRNSRISQVLTAVVPAGALFVLMSLAGWVLWYSGNIDGLTSKKELGHIGSAVDRLARNLSRKIRTYRSQF